jgi:hypothetical protein
VSATTPNAAESGSVAGAFTVIRSGSTTAAAQVKLTWGGSAAYSTDYNVTVSGGTLSADRLTLTIAAGAAAATVTVTPVDDAVTEGGETVVLGVAAGTGYSVGSPSSATVTIADHMSTPTPPAAPTFTVSAPTITEGDRNSSTVTVTVRLSAPSSSTVTVQVRTTDGTATAGVDYRAVSTTTLTFAPNQLTATFTVTILGDKLAEGNETFNVVLSSATGGATIPTAGTPLTIVDNETVAAYRAVALAPSAKRIAVPRTGWQRATKRGAVKRHQIKRISSTKHRVAHRVRALQRSV